MIALSVSAVVAGPLAVFAPLGMAPLAGCVAIVSLLATTRERLWRQVLGHPGASVTLLLLAWMLITTAWTLHAQDALSLFARTAVLIAGGTALTAMLLAGGPARPQRLAQTVVAGFALLVMFLAFELVSEGLLVRTALPERYAHEPWIYVVVSRGTVFMALMMWPTLLAVRALGYRSGIVIVIATALAIAWLTDHGATKIAVAAGLITLALVYWLGRRAVVFIGSLPVALIVSAPLWPHALLAPHAWPVIADWLKLSAVHRLYIWQFVAERVRERPLFGWGFDASRDIPGGDALTPIGVPALSLHPHNAALQVWLELGAVGAALFALIVAMIVRHMAQSNVDRLTQAAAAAALSTSFTVASLSFGIWQSWWVGSVVLMVVWIAALRGAAGGAPHVGTQISA